MVLVVLDVGRCFVRVGIPGETQPTVKFVEPVDSGTAVLRYSSKSAIDPPPSYAADLSMTIDQKDIVMGAILEDPVMSKVTDIYNKETKLLAIHANLHAHLVGLLHRKLLNPTTCRALIIEPWFLSNKEKQELLRILFSEVGIRSVSWVSEPIMETLSSGGMDALVVHMSWLSSRISAINDLRVLNVRENLAFSGQNLHYKIVEKLLALQFPELASMLSSKNGYAMVENFIQTAVFKAPMDFEKVSTDANIKFSGTICIPRSFQHAIIDALLEESGLIADILSVIDNCAIDTRPLIFQNILFEGGLAAIPGVKLYILSEIRRKWKGACANQSQGAWVGASIYVSSLERSEFQTYIKKNELKKETFLRDAITG